MVVVGDKYCRCFDILNDHLYMEYDSGKISQIRNYHRSDIKILDKHSERG